MKFVVIHSLALFLALSAFALIIVSFNAPWYLITTEYSSQSSTTVTSLNAATRLNRTRTFYDVDGFTTELTHGVNSATMRLQNVNWSTDDVMGHVRRVFYIIETFLIIGIVHVIILLLFIVAIFFRTVQRKLLLFPQKLLRFVFFVFAFMTFVGAFVAFFNLRAFTSAIDSDTPGCTAGYCKTFAGSEEDKLSESVIRSVSWQPEASWYTSLVAFILTIPLAFIVLVNRLPAIAAEEDSTGVAL